MQKKQKIFLASSREQSDKRIVEILQDLLSSEEREVLPWSASFSPNEYTLDTLVQQAKACDAAIFVFGADDLLLSRQNQSPAVRDNVLLEYGLFLGILERRRVFILREHGVHMASDLSGIQRVEYTAREADLRKELGECAEKIRRKLEEFGPRDEASIDYFGIPETLRKHLESVSSVRDFLAGRARNPKRVSRSPVHFDSYTATLEAYRQGLEQVEERFWATSFLSSEFWTDEDLAFDLNRVVLRKAKKRDAPIEMRRLLILECDPWIEVKNFGKTVRMLYRSDRDSGINELWGQLQRVKNRHLGLESEGCETRIVGIGSKQKKFRVGSQSFDLSDEELAIYDHFRLDFFGGRGNSQIADVKIFLPGVEDFELALRHAEQLFEELWARGMTLDDYFKDLQREYESSMRRVDHVKNWIYKYHHTLPRRDKDLKKREMEEVLGVVKEFKKSREIRSHLDIGTCTGRYPLGLRDLVAPDGRIVGIDIDPECINYIECEHEAILDEDGRLRFMKSDFLSEGFYAADAAGQFDLITCMMGTISYFGHSVGSGNRVAPVLVGALRKIHSFLSPGGLAVLSIWSDDARGAKDLVDIYTESDKRRLAAWTPGIKELIDELKLAGFETKNFVIPRLDIIACFKL